MVTQIVKFSNIHLNDGTKFENVDLFLDNDFTRQSDVLDMCNTAVEQFCGMNFINRQEIFYTVEYKDMYWKENNKINYSTHNRTW